MVLAGRRLSAPSTIGITGTPGVGKKSVARLVAKSLRYRCIGLNDLAQQYGLLSSRKESAVDTDLFKTKLESRFYGKAVLHGHLLPYVLPRAMAARVVVLRCEPAVLKERLAARGYPNRKIAENIEAELIGLLSSDSFRAFGTAKTIEIDATYTTPTEAAAQIVTIVSGRARPPRRLDWLTNYDSGARLRSLLST